jgi:ATP-dependent Lhr-like helicase
VELFGPPVRQWFAANFQGPTPVQSRGWPVVAAGRHTLLVAPTGSGKTLAAFLWALDRLTRLPPDADPGVRVVYVSPLKALVYDVERNLRAPLAGIRRAAESLGLALRDVRVAVRTGDTPARERQRLGREPAEILVTTPESLYLVLGSRLGAVLGTVEAVIVDEVHALAPTKRGAHLALSLERLAQRAARDPQRIGLSATARPLEEAARFLGGERPVQTVDVRERPALDLRVVVPVPDMQRVPAAPEPRRSASLLGELYAQEPGVPPPERGIWSTLYPAIVERIRAGGSTIVFVNSRGLCERLARRLNELAGEELVQAHHGSVSHERRRAIEEGLKAGTLRGIVATSSLELGIDMGAVDQVLLVESPGSVARGLQRVGRAGHRVGEVSVGRLFPKFRGDLLECVVVAERMSEGRIESFRVPRNPLDVLAQQVVALCAERPRRVAEIAALARRAYPYHGLSDDALTAVLDMLAGRYPSTALADLTPLLAWDRATDVLTARAGAALVARLNAGTIPDRGAYPVHLGLDGPRVGELDEEMVFETRTGDRILLGTTTWKVEAVTRDRVVVSQAPGEAGRMPFWRGEGPGRPVELGRAIGALVARLGGMTRAQAVQHLLASAPVDLDAAQNLAAYIDEQKAHTGVLPTDRRITVERFRDELGDWRICILTPFGARLHGPWAMALERQLGGQLGAELQVMYTDDGIVLRFADVEELPGAGALFPDPDEVEDLVTEQLAETALFASLFRENAGRALLLPRRRPGRRTPLWVQRQKARQLLAEVRRYPGFPIMLETYRQALADVFDMRGLRELLGAVRARAVAVDSVETRCASPFARSLVFAYVAAFIYEQDSPLAERKAQALTLDRALLAELLGQAELRELIDAGVLEALERDLQHLSDGRRAAGPDALHDLLRRLGDLSLSELEARAEGDPGQWLARLERERRAARVRVAGEPRWIAAEDAGLYRDALGCQPPPGLPAAFLEAPPDALERVLRRYARTRGPFLTGEASRRLGLAPAVVEGALHRLERDGQLVRGEIRPGGSAPEWCDGEVLRRVKRETLAHLRRAVAPLPGRVLGAFLPAWQAVGGAQPGPDRLETAVRQLEGLGLPWSALTEAVLPARVPGFTTQGLDGLVAMGWLLWVGVAPLGPGDGRVALYRREQARRLLPPADGVAAGPVEAAIAQALASRGAQFLVDLEATVRAALPALSRAEFEGALWALVWKGLLTNDTFAPLRALRGGAREGRRGWAMAGGRWSLLKALRDPGVPQTERALAWAEVLLERYGVVAREVAQAEGIEGGFGPLYQVLKAMEEAGRVRRGYFVEGLSGAQFATAGALDRLRGLREAAESDQEPGAAEVRALAALDPANPYGALLPWPVGAGGGDARPRRAAGAWVVLVGGEARAYLAPGGRQLLTFPGTGPDPGDVALGRALDALAALRPGQGRRSFTIEQVDGEPAGRSPLRALLLRAGFQPDHRGLTAPGPH